MNRGKQNKFPPEGIIFVMCHHHHQDDENRKAFIVTVTVLAMFPSHLLIACIFLLSSWKLSVCFLATKTLSFRSRGSSQANAQAASLIAGSLAGVIGIGAAYPLDALKTKTQTLAATNSSNQRSMLGVANEILATEGIQGFYGGVGGVMFGEAFVKASMFGSNAWCLSQLLKLTSEVDPSIVDLSIAAAFSGLMSSLILNPIDRIKILMQTDSSYTSEMDCISKVLTKDGVGGLLFRGLDSMWIREIPGCTVYFLAYSLFMKLFFPIFGPSAPFLCGGLAGVSAWIPIYPSDVIKTAQQNTLGSIPSDSKAEGQSSRSQGYFVTAMELNNKFGPGIFFEGIQPKLLRAAVNHSVTFFCYDLIIRWLNKVQ